MRNKDLQNHIDSPFMKVIPQAANHVIIVNRENNAIDISSDPSNENFYIITKSGQRVVINIDGSPAIQCGGK